MGTNCTKLVAVDDLVMENNVRTAECMHVPQMVASLRIHGYLPNHPVLVSEKPDGKFLVLAGNRRASGVIWLKENDPETYRVAVNSGKVPAVVHKGLTPEEEVDLRIDHSKSMDRVPLDQWSLFLAIQQLDSSGRYTQDQIAIKLGLVKESGKKAGEPRREFVQVRTNLGRLPQFVQDEFRKLTLDKDSTLIRWSTVSGLYKVYNEEYVDHIDGKGPLFTAAWAKCMTPEEVTDTASQDEPKELTPAEAVKRSQAANSQALKQVFLVVTRQAAGNLAEIDAIITEGESAIVMLQAIREYLGEQDYADLVKDSQKQRDAKEANEGAIRERSEKEPIEA